VQPRSQVAAALRQSRPFCDARRSGATGHKRKGRDSAHRGRAPRWWRLRRCSFAPRTSVAGRTQRTKPLGHRRAGARLICLEPAVDGANLRLELSRNLINWQAFGLESPRLIDPPPIVTRPGSRRCRRERRVASPFVDRAIPRKGAPHWAHFAKVSTAKRPGEGQLIGLRIELISNSVQSFSSMAEFHRPTLSRATLKVFHLLQASRRTDPVVEG